MRYQSLFFATFLLQREKEASPVHQVISSACHQRWPQEHHRSFGLLGKILHYPVSRLSCSVKLHPWHVWLLTHTEQLWIIYNITENTCISCILCISSGLNYLISNENCKTRQYSQYHSITFGPTSAKYTNSLSILTRHASYSSIFT